MFPPLNGPCLITSLQVCMWCLHCLVSLVITAPPPGPDSVWLLARACSPRCPRPGPAPAEPGLHTPARTAHAQTLHYWHPALQHSTLTHLWQNWDQGDNRSQAFRYIGFTHNPNLPYPMCQYCVDEPWLLSTTVTSATVVGDWWVGHSSESDLQPPLATTPWSCRAQRWLDAG